MFGEHLMVGKCSICDKCGSRSEYRSVVAVRFDMPPSCTGGAIADGFIPPNWNGGMCTYCVTALNSALQGGVYSSWRHRLLKLQLTNGLNCEQDLKLGWTDQQKVRHVLQLMAAENEKVE